MLPCSLPGEASRETKTYKDMLRYALIIRDMWQNRYTHQVVKENYLSACGKENPNCKFSHG